LPPESSTTFRQPLSAEIDSALIQWSAIRAISRLEYRNDATVAIWIAEQDVSSTVIVSKKPSTVRSSVRYATRSRSLGVARDSAPA
jgi:hypothetical protein